MKNFFAFLCSLILFSVPGRAIAAVSFNASSVRTVYTGSNVTTSTSLQIVSSLPYPTDSILVFDSSGQTMQLNITNPGGIVTSVIIPPGGGSMPLKITTGSSVSIIAISGNPANATENDINFFY